MPVKEHIDLEDVFINYYNELVSYANSILFDTAASEDIVQDVFLKLMEKKNLFQIKGISYLYLSVKNSCLNHLQHKKVKEKHSPLLKVHYEDTLTSSKKINKEESIIISKALDKLPFQCKRIFILCCIEGVKYVDVAEDLDISINSVKKQMSKAYRILKKELKSQSFIFFIFFPETEVHKIEA